MIIHNHAYSHSLSHSYLSFFRYIRLFQVGSNGQSGPLIPMTKMVIIDLKQYNIPEKAEI